LTEINSADNEETTQKWLLNRIVTCISYYRVKFGIIGEQSNSNLDRNNLTYVVNKKLNKTGPRTLP